MKNSLIFNLLTSISIISVFISPLCADNKTSSDGNRTIISESITKILTAKSKKENKASIGNKSKTDLLQQLFAPYKVSGKLKVWKNTKTLISAKQFAEMLIKEVDSLSSEDLKIIETALHNADNIDIGIIGLKCINSDNYALQALGFELLVDTCINKIRFFRPREFHDAFVEKAFETKPFILEIIENTNDDFCREWAYELHNEIFYDFYNTKENRERRRRLKLKEKKIYEKLKTLFSDSKKVQKIVASKQLLGESVRQTMGVQPRYTMKMRAVIKLLDNLNKKNIYATTQQLFKILKEDNFEYNILNRINNQPQNLPPIPDALRLRYLAKAVFNEKTTNTYKWLKKKNGGFGMEDVKTAIKKNDKAKITYMKNILWKYICAILKKQLPYGQGSRELEILRYFYFATWDKKHIYDDNLITIRNHSSNAIALILSHEVNIEKMLTGKSIIASSMESRSEKFYIPAQSIFVWFVPDGDYTLSVDLEDKVIRGKKLLTFDDKKFSIEKFNMTLNIY